MSITTIQCRLTASEATRQYLWEIMANQNTPLVTELMLALQRHDDFEGWKQAGRIPVKAIRDVCASLKQDDRFSGQPGRFYSSACTMVGYTYEAWFALQASRQRRLQGLQRWLAILKSDAEMLELCEITLEELKARAEEVLQQTSNGLSSKPSASRSTKRGNRRQQDQAVNTVSRREVVSRLFQLHDESSDPLTQYAIVHLLKNGCIVPEKEEQSDKYRRMLSAKQKAARRLHEQLVSSLPKGRDLSGERFLEILELLTNQNPSSTEEFIHWKNLLLKEPSPLPYPILYGSNNDLAWFTQEVPRGRSKLKQQICVKFNGLSQHVFKVQCDRRQHHYFQRFVQDWEVYQRGKGPISGSLLLLRTASLMWKPAKQSSSQKTNEPWNSHYLYLHCQIDTQLLTREGVSQKRQKKLTSLEERANNSSSDLSTAAAKRQQGNLDRLSRTEEYPIPLPSRPAYQGHPHLVLGVSFDIKQPVTLAVVDVHDQRVVKYQTSRQLLKSPDKHKDQSHLLRRQKFQKQTRAHERYKAQKRDQHIPYQEADLGIYLNRVLAKRVVNLAYQFKVSSIVLPNTHGLRDKLESQLRAKAEQKIVGCVAAQKRYARQASQKLHHWSYNQLAEFIQDRAAKVGIPVETVSSFVLNTPQETARETAMSAYYHRQARVK